MITSIIKRDGSIEPFNPEKIVIAISKAGSATGEFDTQVSKELVNSMVLPRINAKKGRAVSVEDVQDIVENVLFDTAFEKSYKAYTLYREDRRKSRETKKALIDVEKSMNEYLRQDDWRVKANANQGYSLGGMILNISGKITANYWLNNVYPEEVGVAHRNGDYHIHDLDMLSGYCAGWSLRSLLNEGFNGVANKVESNPPKHVSSALLQMVNFLGSLQNEWAGAQAFSSFDTYLAPFVRVDKLSYEELKQRIQEFIYNLNVPSRWGCVPTTTEILTLDGWKSVYSLKKTDVVYSVGEKGELRLSNINTIVHKAKAKRKMIAFKNSHYGYEQYVTDNHRCITTTANKKLDECKIALAEEVKNRFNEGLTVKFPVKLTNTNVLKNTSVLYTDVSDAEVMFASAMYCDGSFDYRGDSLHKVTYYKSTKRQAPEWFEGLCEELRLKYTKTAKPTEFSDELCRYVFYGEDARRIEKLVGHKNKIEEKFLHMNEHQSRLFLETWAKHDGDEEKLRLQFDTDCICKGLQHIAINAGSTSYIYLDGKTRYVKLRKVDLIEVKECVEIEEECEVWCPSVTHGTVIFRDKDGNVFLSGNTQTPFTNLTFDIHCPEDIRDDIPLIGGKEVDFKYGDLQKEMDMINKAYMEVMIAGDAHGRIFTFPIPTYNISKDFDWDSANSELLFEMTAKYGLPYFQNFINSELKPNQIRSMCCRLQLDLRELLKRGNGLFGSAEQTGSVGVVTINCARLGYVFKGDKEGLYKRLDYLMGLAKTSLEIKRKEVQKHMDQGLFPFTKRYLGTLRNHFSTIGVNGINEMIRNFTNDKFDITSEEGHAFAIEFLDHVRAKMVEYQEETGNLYNLEATPAEGTTYRFAKEDKKRWPDIIQAGTTKNNYYTNSSQLPVGFTDDPFEALEMQDDLQRKYTGGTVLHLYMGERISTSHACKELVKRALTHFKLPYITITPTFSICPKHGYIAGEHKFCPLCDDELVAKKKKALLKCQKVGTGK